MLLGVVGLSIAGILPPPLIDDLPPAVRSNPPFTESDGFGADCRVDGALLSVDTINTGAKAQRTGVARGKSFRRCIHVPPGTPSHGATFNVNAPGSITAVTSLGGGSSSSWDLTVLPRIAGSVKPGTPLKAPVEAFAEAKIRITYKLQCDAVSVTVQTVDNVQSRSKRATTGNLSSVVSETTDGEVTKSVPFVRIALCEFASVAGSTVETRVEGVLSITSGRLVGLRRQAAPGDATEGNAWDAPLGGGQQARAAVISKVEGSSHVAVCQ